LIWIAAIDVDASCLRGDVTHILILSNAARTLIRFRGHLIKDLLTRGYRVTACAAEEDEEVARILSEWGVEFLPVRLGRTGMNPLADLGALRELVSLIRRLRPDVFFGYTIKPVIYGLLAAKICGVPRRIAMITGLGYAFTEGPGTKRKIARIVAKSAYRFALLFSDRVIFQNSDDQKSFMKSGLVRGPAQTAVVAGSGVDLSHYAPAPLPDGPVQFLMIARLLHDKGVREFAEAARFVKRKYSSARFVLVGRYDSNPAAIQAAEVNTWIREGILVHRGELTDVRPEIAACHVYVLPSYREGMPRTVLEALAMGRAIITTDVPGCRETVEDGKNGILVPPRDSAALATAMIRCADDRRFVAIAGEQSLALARARFDVNAVNAAIIAIIEGVDGARSA
jgi:glycosyltransferase involved in cell wall biosynthesis